MAEFPRDWQVDTIGNLAQLKAGRDRFETSHCDGDYPWYGGNGIRGYSSRHSYDGIYPIIGRQGELCGNVKLAKGKFSATEHAVVVTCKSEVVPEFFYYSLTFANLNQYATGCAQPGLSVQKIGAIPITLPAFDEQRRIADALGSVDKLIDNLTRRIEKKRLVKQGVMQELLTGKKRLPGFKGEWKRRTLGELAEITTGATPLTSVREYWGGDIRWMNSGEIHHKRINEVAGRITTVGYDATSTTMLPIHTVLIALAGQGRTRGTVAITEIPLCTNQSIAGIVPSPAFDSFFLYYYLDNKYNVLREVSSGDGSRGGLSKTILERFPVDMPPMRAEQRAIAEVLSDMDAEIAKLEAKRDKYIDIKRGMMNDLLTGKVRI